MSTKIRTRKQEAAKRSRTAGCAVHASVIGGPGENTLMMDEAGTIFTYTDGKLHSHADNVAVSFANGTKQWYKHDVLHRDAGPAIIDADGTKVWMQNGKVHRADGPAVTKPGQTAWFYEGELHRVGGPAIETAEFSLWFHHGVSVRVGGGYAVEFADGRHAHSLKCKTIWH